MKRISALFGCIFSLLIITAAAVSAEEKDVAAPAPTGIGQLLRLLQDKNVITAEDAAALGKQSALGIDKENMNNLLNLLQGKGVITSEEAANLADNPAGSAKKLPGPAGRNTATVPLVLPMDDRRFVQLLKDKWVDVGKRIDEFYPTFNDSRDPEYIISRMKAAEVITDDEAFELLRQYRTYYLSGAVATSLEAKEKTYLDRISKSVVADLEKNALPKIRNDWTQRLKLSGDLRLRYEADYFDKANGVQMKPDNTSQLLNTTIDRTRSAIRARLGLEAKVTDDITAGIGLATGNSTNPVSTNSAMGDTLNKKNFLVDRAYLNWNPAPALSVWGGRFPNPWFYSDLVWDADINFEGVAVQYHPRLSSSWGLFFNGGIFPIQEVELSGKDKWLFGAQIGAEYQKKGLLTARLGAAIYDFKNTVGVVDPSNSGLTNWSTPQFMQ
ncbi:MAG: putative porin, partial [Geobacteraceae bacterium]|nr:putative porin [Geobacteraceae bacterium]